MKTEKKDLIEYAVTIAAAALSLILLDRLGPTIVLGGKEKESYYLVLLALSPILITFSLSRLGRRSLFSSLYLGAVEIYTCLVILSNLGIYTARKEVVFYLLSTLVLALETIHLRSRSRKMNGSLYFNFKWIEEEEHWEKVQDMASRSCLILTVESLLLLLASALELLPFSISFLLLFCSAYVFILILLKKSK